MDPVFQLAIALPARGSRERLRALHVQLRAAILDGRLQPGLRLPATRALADTLGVSRNTAVAAYDLLLSEGYLQARPGAGTYVADMLARPAPHRRAARRDGAAPDARLAAPWRTLPPLLQPLPGTPYRHDLRTGLPDPHAFPFDVWRRLAARQLRAFAKAPQAYAEPQGRAALRAAIASHVSFTRAVACSADDVLVTAGAQQAFDLLARILVTPRRTLVALEDPGYPPLRAAFAAQQARLASVPVDDEGLRVDRLPAGTRVICVTPSHQFPLGVAMSARRRAELLAFAREHGAVIIEDDYDGEFRFGGRPLDALQTLDGAASVFYVGTFSKVMFPALRIGFVVAPPWAQPALAAAKQLADWQVPPMMQDTLAAFIAEGHLVRHVRKMRGVYAQRRETLLHALARHCGALQPIASEAGLHLSAHLPGRLPAPVAVERAADAGLAVEALQRYRATPAARGTAINGLAMGYGLIEAARIEDAVRVLARCLR